MVLRAMALLAALLVLPAAGHPDGDAELLPWGTYLDHTRSWDGTLEPGASNGSLMAWGGTHLREGWLVLWSGEVHGGPLKLTWSHDNETVSEWEWDPGQRLHIEPVPENGTYDLTVSNLGEEEATFALHWDVTCDCTGKLLERPGAVWFNLEAGAGTVDLEFAVVAFDPPGRELPPRGNVSVRASVATWPGEGTGWPDDFRRITGVETTIGPHEERFRVVELPFEVQDPGRQLVLVEVAHDGPEGWHFQLKPKWTTSPPADAAVPLEGALLVLLVALLARARKR